MFRLRPARAYFASVFLLHLGCSASDSGQPTCDVDKCDVDYTPVGECDGLPRIDVETPPGVCVGLVTDEFRMPRGLTELANGDLIVADMGGWGANIGTVWRLHRNGDGTFERTQILDGIDKPSGAVTGPDGLPYIGAADAVFRFDPDEPGRPRLTLVARDLPTSGRHPLTHMVFDALEPTTLYVNVGSETDVCEEEGSTSFSFPCREETGEKPRGGIRKYTLDPNSLTEVSFETMALGLRNSMALAVHPESGLLLQAENSRDAIDAMAPELSELEWDLPHEELNVIEPGAHYGWPYCYDNGQNSPEYPDVDCSAYQTPALLLPGHAAPLGMEYYQGTMFPEEYRGNLIVGYHGYRENGHRVVVVPVDETGVPVGEPLDLIRGWSGKETAPRGAPVDILVANDGSIYIADDKNDAILRVFYDPSKGDGAPMAPLPIEVPKPRDVQALCDDLATRSDAFSDIQRNLIDESCVSCHGAGPGFPGGLELNKCDAVGNAERLLAPRDGVAALVVPGDLNSELILRLEGRGVPRMPTQGVSEQRIEEVRAWIRDGAPAP